MKKTLVCLLVGLLVASAAHAQQCVFNRAPLAENDFAQLPFGAIEARGWLREQLVRQKNGLTGHLDEWYAPIVGDDNAWLGGEGDTWERGPYWIDGLLPLAWLLQDPELMAKARKWTDAMLNSAREDGYFGNAVSRPYIEGFQRGKAQDWWPKMVAVKILQQYYLATGDARAIEVLTGWFRYQAAHLDETPLDYWSSWGRWRGGDNLTVIYWLYNLTGESFLLELGEKVHAQTADWTRIFTSGPELYTQHSLHCVNLAQGLKEPGIHWQYSRDSLERRAPRQALETIRHTFGFPTGLWAGDELVRFGNPSQGSELCTAVEAMYSAEELLKATGDPYWADYLERVAFNALPTQATDAYDARQYYQQINQIECSRTVRDFVTEHYGTDNVYGLLNGYPCCTCNMHQGWPKLTAHLWLASRDGGLAALVYGPSKVSARVADGISVTILEETLYPFRGDVRLTVDFPDQRCGKVRFPLYLRIPAWCTGARIRIGKEEVESPGAGRILRIERPWKKGDSVSLSFDMEVRTSRWYDGSTVVERGPLVYALRMDERWESREFSGRDREQYGPRYEEVRSESPWNYGFSLKTLQGGQTFRVTEHPLDENTYPWNLESAPVSIRAKAIRLPAWKACRGSVGPVAYYKEDGKDWDGEADIELIPYGCTTLRICEFPTRH